MKSLSMHRLSRLALVVGLAGLVAIGGAHLRASGVQNSQISIRVTSTNQKAIGLSTVQDPMALDYSLLLASGTGANQASNVFHDQRTLTASSSENLDLAGTLTNAFGTTLTFTKIKGMIFHAASTNTNNVLIGGAASNGFINWVGDTTDIITLRPGGTFILLAPDATAYGVTASTGDLLKIANSSSGTSVVYDVTIIGVD